MANCPQCKKEVPLMAERCSCGYRFGQPQPDKRPDRHLVQRGFPDVCILVLAFYSLILAICAVILELVVAGHFIWLVFQPHKPWWWVGPTVALLLLPIVAILHLGMYYLSMRALELSKLSHRHNK